MTDKPYWASIQETPDEHGGTVLDITALDTNEDTVTPQTLLKGITAHDAQGNPIVGEHTCIEKKVKVVSIRQRYRHVGFVLRHDIRRIGLTAVRYGGTRLPYYEGDYVIDPKFTEIILPTNGHVMRDDVTVNSIMVSVTENLSGGNTVYIGME